MRPPNPIPSISIPENRSTDVDPPRTDVIGIPAGMEDGWEGEALDSPEYVDPEAPHPSDVPPPPPMP